METKQRQSRKFKGIRCWFSANQLKDIFRGYYGQNLTNEELAELFEGLTEERVVSMIEEMALDQLIAKKSAGLTARELVTASPAKVKPIVQQELELEKTNSFGEIDFDAALDSAFDD